MATIKSAVQTYSALTVTALPTLVSANYCVSNTITHSANQPLDVLIDVAVATTNVIGASSNKQVVIFAKGSIDGTNFGSGPESGTTTTDEPNLHYVGSVPVGTQSTTERKIFSLAAAYGGTLPVATKLVFKNDLGATLTTGTVQIAEVWGVAV
jgi:hypothetical protein